MCEKAFAQDGKTCSVSVTEDPAPEICMGSLDVQKPDNKDYTDPKQIIGEGAKHQIWESGPAADQRLELGYP